jgi:hypothetical protein
MHLTLPSEREMCAKAETTFASITTRLLGKPNTETGVAFHQPTLKADGKIFAMLVREELVVKLPAARCAELVSTGVARRFDRGGGSPMKQWVSIGNRTAQAWSRLAREALAFVGR